MPGIFYIPFFFNYSGCSRDCIKDYFFKLHQPFLMCLLTAMPVIDMNLGIIKIKIHTNVQVSECVPQEDSVTLSQKLSIIVSLLAPVILLIKAKQCYTALTMY